jgi:hypothetical protein
MRVESSQPSIQSNKDAGGGSPTSRYDGTVLRTGMLGPLAAPRKSVLHESSLKQAAAGMREI